MQKILIKAEILNYCIAKTKELALPFQYFNMYALFCILLGYSSFINYLVFQYIQEYCSDFCQVSH